MAAARARSHRPGLSSSPPGSEASSSAWILEARGVGEDGAFTWAGLRSAAMASTSRRRSRISSARNTEGSSSAVASTRMPLRSRNPHSTGPVTGHPRRRRTASTSARRCSHVSMAEDYSPASTQDGDDAAGDEEQPPAPPGLTLASTTVRSPTRATSSRARTAGGQDQVGIGMGIGRAGQYTPPARPPTRGAPTVSDLLSCRAVHTAEMRRIPAVHLRPVPCT